MAISIILDLTVTDNTAISGDITVTDSTDIGIGYDAVSYTISSIAQNGANPQLVLTTTNKAAVNANQLLYVGAEIKITGTTNYNGKYDVLTVDSSTEVTLNSPFISTESPSGALAAFDYTDVAGDITVTDNTAVTNDLSVTDNTAISGDITVTDPTVITNDLTVTDNTVVTNDLTVTDNTVVTNDLTVTDPTALEIDVSVTDPTDVIINPLDGLVLFDFESNPSLTNQNYKTIQRSLTSNGTITYNDNGYYDLAADTDSKFTITQDITDQLPPAPVQAHQWYEMKYVVGITGASSSTILNPQGEGFRWKYTSGSGGTSTVEYYKDTVFEWGDSNIGALSGKIEATFSCYYNGADTIIKSVVNGVTGIDRTLTGDKRIVTEPLSDMIFGFAATIDKIYYISWQHSDTKTNADFT